MAVVTNPDRPAGRGMGVRASPVKDAALAAGLDVLQPARAREPGLRERIEEILPDVAVVVAYGSILPADLLLVPRLGFVNLHFSLLPEYRGAAPVQRAVMNGVEETGVSVMVLTEGMDEGPVLARRSVAIYPAETAGALGKRLADLGAPLLAETLTSYAAGALAPEEQDHARATYAPKISPEEARIDWSRSASSVVDHVRGLNPAPGAWTEWEGKRLKVWEAREVEGESLAPGLLEGGPSLLVGTGTSAVELVDVQLAGKRRMAGTELARGLRLDAGGRLT